VDHNDACLLQGDVLSPPAGLSNDELRALLAPIRRPVSIAVECAGNAFAVGAIIRVAHSFLVREIILIGTEPHYEKASMGMEKLETIVRVADEAAFLQHVGARPIVAFERECATRSLYDEAPFPNDPVLLFGSERFGVSVSLLRAAHEVVAIPQHGVNNSLPLAVAAGIAMSEWTRRYLRTP
jgi:tRNA G18 (ribose-2'-O)-methylase SpoU